MMGAAILACTILGILLVVVWIVMLIPTIVSPRVIPDPRPRITAAVVRHGVRNAMKGNAAATVK